jgi:hypothetical protein
LVGAKIGVFPFVLLRSEKKAGFFRGAMKQLHLKRFASGF